MPLSRRRFLSLPLAAAACSPGPSGGESPPPNVLFLAVDDMRDWVGFLAGYGGKVHTPNLDRLAERGAWFANAHCASPVCCPSRTAVMSGRRPSTTGIYNNGQWWKPHLPDLVTLPMRFRREGYRTVGAGKLFHHTAGNNPPSQWDAYRRLDFRNDPWFRESRENYPWVTPAPYPAEFPFSGVAGLGHENDWGAPPIPDEEYDDRRTADYAAEFLSSAGKHPFFLGCGIFRPHLPWYVPGRFFDLYPLDEIVLPEAPADDLDDIPEPGLRLARARRSDLDAIRSQGREREAVRAYLASISFADEQIGRVLEALQRRGLAERTLVVFWSDHGWHLGEKGHWHKSTLWGEATRVPLVVAGPGVTPGRRDQPVSLVDLYPTLNELCGFEPDPEHDGFSLAPILADPSAPRAEPAVVEFERGQCAVCDARYRYIRYEDGSEEFYDRQTDPREWANRAADPAYAAAKAELARWATTKWAPEAPRKNAYEFLPDVYSWKEKATGRIVRG